MREIGKGNKWAEARGGNEWTGVWEEHLWAGVRKDNRTVGWAVSFVKTFMHYPTPSLYSLPDLKAALGE